MAGCEAGKVSMQKGREKRRIFLVFNVLKLSLRAKISTNATPWQFYILQTLIEVLQRELHFIMKTFFFNCRRFQR